MVCTILKHTLLLGAVLSGLASAVAVAATPVYYGNSVSQWVSPMAVPTPNSSSLIIGFGDSTTEGSYGPTTCVSASTAPAVTSAAAATGNCWMDRIARFYGARVQNLGVGGTLLLSGSGAGNFRYNMPYACTATGTSPTSGLNTPCNTATYPALDTTVGLSTFIYFAYNGINDSSTYPNKADYGGALAAYIAIANELIAHGEPADHIIFIGPPKGGLNNGFFTQYLVFAAAEANAAMGCGCSFVSLWSTQDPSNTDSGAYYYDSIHPNDTGSGVWATAIEGVTGIGGTLNAGAYLALGSLLIQNGLPKFDTNGDLTLPANTSLHLAAATITNGGNGTFAGFGKFAGPVFSGTYGAYNPPAGYIVSAVTSGTGGFIFGQGSGVLDYGVSTASTFTFNHAVYSASAISSTTGMQPNGLSGGYAPEAFPLGVAVLHPQMITGSCASIAVGGTTCTFPNSFTFGGTTYLCQFSAEGATVHFFSYDTKGTTSMKVYSDAGTPTADYVCVR